MRTLKRIMSLSRLAAPGVAPAGRQIIAEKPFLRHNRRHGHAKRPNLEHVYFGLAAFSGKQCLVSASFQYPSLNGSVVGV